MLDHGAPPSSGTPTVRRNPGVGVRLMRRKPVERLVAEGGRGEGGSLRRTLGLWQLTMISIGATLGPGIFVVLGEAVPKAGPAVTLSFVVAGLTALFSATPRANTLLVSLFCGVLAAAIPLGQLADATGIGTLFAFALVNVAVVVLRRSRPEMPRTFRVPLSPLLPAVGFGFCVWMMGSLSAVTWVVFGVWMAVGLVFYFLYGYRRSRLAAPDTSEAK